MKPDEYQKLAARTMKFPRPCNHDVVDYTMGLVGEACEVARATLYYEGKTKRVQSEIGDTLWYAAALCSVHDEKLSSMMKDIGATTPESKDMHALALRLCASAGAYCEAVKKAYFHNHPLMPDLSDYLPQVLKSITSLCRLLNLSIDDTMYKNIEKLKERYPWGFLAEDSIARVDLDGR